MSQEPGLIIASIGRASVIYFNGKTYGEKITKFSYEHEAGEYPILTIEMDDGRTESFPIMRGESPGIVGMSQEIIEKMLEAVLTQRGDLINRTSTDKTCDESYYDISKNIGNMYKQ